MNAIVIRLVFLLITAFLPSGCDNSDAINDVMKAHNLIRSVQNSNLQYKDLETTSLSQAVDLLDKSIRSGDLDTEQTVFAHYWRGNALSFANLIRNAKNEDVVVLELKRALDDYDYVIATTEIDKYPGIIYYAARIASNLLNDKNRAGKYFKKCAEDRHAGCMNVLARGYFHGDYGFEVDVQKSIDWHTKVFDTGTDYNCAGSYSGGSLALMSFFLPQFQYRHDWRTWMDKSVELKKSLADEKHINPCYLMDEYVFSYLLHLLDHEKRQDILEKAAILSNGGQVEIVDKVTIRYFLGDAQRSVLDQVLAYETDHAIRCDAYHYLIMHNMAVGNQMAVKNDLKALKQLKGRACENTVNWIRIMSVTR